ncbi:MAG: M48 family metalloprotease [Alphaproteobacteria bacterium]|nr:M48 family metalloprotease [Alphaproteobacteria bacterium]
MRKIFVFLIAVFFCVPARALSVINDTETESVLRKIIMPVALAANIPENRLKIHIVNDDDFNAFVSGGEDVFIYTGLLTRIKNTNALQAVVAHELGHMIGGHMAQMSARMEAELKRTLIIQALGIGLMVAGGNPSLGAGILAGAGGVAQQSLLSFSRDEERVADEFAVDLMVDANINPTGLITVFEQMQNITGAAEAKINKNRSNHPLTVERIKNARDKIAQIKHNQKYKTYDDKEYELVRAKLIGYLYTERQILDKYPYRATDDAAIYACAIGNMRGGALTAARDATQDLIQRNKKNPYYYELLGDIEYQMGHYDDAVAAYEHALKLNKNAPQIQTALALVLAERGKPGDNAQAIELCKTSLLATPAPLTYWVLAKLYDDGREYWALAEFYNLNGDTKKSRTFAKRAQQKLDKDSPEYIKSGDILEK